LAATTQGAASQEAAPVFFNQALVPKIPRDPKSAGLALEDPTRLL